MFLYQGGHLIPGHFVRAVHLKQIANTRHETLYSCFTFDWNTLIYVYMENIHVLDISTLAAEKISFSSYDDRHWGKYGIEDGYSDVHWLSVTLRHHWQAYILVGKLWRRAHGWRNYIISRVFNMGAPLRMSGNVPHGLMAALSTCITVVISGISKLLAACELNWYMGRATVLPEFCTPPTPTYSFLHL